MIIMNTTNTSIDIHEISVNLLSGGKHMTKPDKPKNYDFVQLYRKEGITALRVLSQANSTALNVYLYLILQMDRANAYLCSLKGLAGEVER